MHKIKSILFVCTGNSCRSVMAEGMMKKYLKELGKEQIEVQSAGIMAISDFSPTDETIKVMKEEGADVSGYRSKSLTHDLIKKADVILAMEKVHKDMIIQNIPEASSKTYLLKEFGRPDMEKNSPKSGIADPIGKSIEQYRICLNEIKEEIERIARTI